MSAAHIYPNNQGKFRRPRYRKLTPEERKRIKVFPLECVTSGEDILDAIHTFRFLDGDQISELFFRGYLLPTGKKELSWQGAKDAANESIRRLLALDLIEPALAWNKLPQKSEYYRHSVKVLTPDGAKALQQHWDRIDNGQTVGKITREGDFSSLMMHHHLRAHHIVIRLMRLIGDLGGHTLSLYLDPHLRSMSRRQHSVFGEGFIPDAIMLVAMPRLDGTTRYLPLFIENDMATETVVSRNGRGKDWQAKIFKYGDLFRSGGWRAEPIVQELLTDYGLDFSQIADPVVLTVTTSAERRTNMVKATLDADGGNTYWYALYEDLFPLRPEGRSGRVYRDALREWEGRDLISASTTPWSVSRDTPRLLVPHLTGIVP